MGFWGLGVLVSSFGDFPTMVYSVDFSVPALERSIWKDSFEAGCMATSPHYPKPTLLTTFWGLGFRTKLFGTG